MNFRSLRVSTRIQWLIGLVLVGLIVLALTSLLGLKATLLQDRKEKTRNLVESAHTLLTHYRSMQKAGVLDEAAAKNAAMTAVKALRYDGKEYFWINDLGTPVPKMVMHATVPALDGTLLDADKFNCATSLQAGLDGKVIATDGRKNLFASFVEVANSAGRGYVTYNWPKPKEGGGTTTELYPKLSFVMKFDDWGWVIGSGIYVDDVERKFREEAVVLAGIALVCLVLMSVLGWLIGSSILRQLGGEPAAAVGIMQQVADGDLTVSVGNAPAGSLLASLGAMVGNLATLVAEIKSSGNRLIDNASAIKSASGQIASAAEQQADATCSMAAAIEELTVSSSLISDSARDTEKDSSEAVALASEGSQRVAEATEAIRHIAGSVVDASTRIHALEERTVQVSSIANVIKEIAGQTNLLALNAAIEAARAGEQGRGFAVVADEVRKLAERTALATTEIEQMIGGIQSDTAASVQAMNDVLPRVEHGVGLVGNASESLTRIESGANRTLERVAEVAVSTREQSNAATAISQRIEEITQMVEETTANVHRTAETAEALEGIARSLGTQIGRFRV